MASVQDWIKARPFSPPGRFNIISFSLFSLLCLGATADLGHWPLFAFLFVLDALGTLSAIDTMISADRAFFFLITLLLTFLEYPFDIFSLSLEMLGIIAVLDFSFLLRRVDGTSVDRSILTNRVKSYAYTIIPPFLLTYLLLYFYSVNLQFNSGEAVLALGLGTVGIFASMYAIIRFLLLLDRRT